MLKNVTLNYMVARNRLYIALLSQARDGSGVAIYRRYH